MKEFTADALAGIFSSDEGVNEFLDWLQNESSYTESKKKSILENLAGMILNESKYMKPDIIIKKSRHPLMKVP